MASDDEPALPVLYSGAEDYPLALQDIGLIVSTRHGAIGEAENRRLPAVAAGSCESCPELIRREMIAMNLDQDPSTAMGATAIRATSDMLRLNCFDQGPTFRRGCSSTSYVREGSEALVRLLLEQALQTKYVSQGLDTIKSMDEKTALQLSVVKANTDSLNTMQHDLATMDDAHTEPTVAKMFRSSSDVMSEESKQEKTLLTQEVAEGVAIMRALTQEGMLRAGDLSNYVPTAHRLIMGRLRWTRWNSSVEGRNNGFDLAPHYEDPVDVISFRAPYAQDPKHRFVTFELKTEKGRLKELLQTIIEHPENTTHFLDFIAQHIQDVRSSKNAAPEQQEALRMLGILSITTEVNYHPTGR